MTLGSLPCIEGCSHRLSVEARTNARALDQDRGRFVILDIELDAASREHLHDAHAAELAAAPEYDA